MVTAQKSTVELRILDSAIYNTQQKYLAFMGTAVPLYYGPEYVEYFRQLTNGHPFFLNNKFNLGTIKYDNILYENIRFKYDEVQDKLAIADAFSGTTCISPSFEKVSTFSIQDNLFIKLVKDTSNPSIPRTGFYQVLHNNKQLCVLKKETKQILEDLNDKSGPKRYVYTSVKYFIRKGNTYYASNTRNSLLTIFKEKKTELRLFIRKNELDFFEDFEKSLMSLVDQYELLIK